MGKEALAESVRSCESPTPAGTLGAVAAAPRVTPCPPRVPPSLHGAVTAGPWPGGGGRRRPCRDRLLPARPCRARGGRLYSTPVPPHVWAPAAAAARRLLRAQPGKNNNNKKKGTHTQKKTSYLRWRHRRGHRARCSPVPRASGKRQRRPRGQDPAPPVCCAPWGCPKTLVPWGCPQLEWLCGCGGVSLPCGEGASSPKLLRFRGM